MNHYQLSEDVSPINSSQHANFDDHQWSDEHEVKDKPAADTDATHTPSQSPVPSPSHNHHSRNDRQFAFNDSGNNNRRGSTAYITNHSPIKPSRKSLTTPITLTATAATTEPRPRDRQQTIEKLIALNTNYSVSKPEYEWSESSHYDRGGADREIVTNDREPGTPSLSVNSAISEIHFAKIDIPTNHSQQAQSSGLTTGLSQQSMVNDSGRHSDRYHRQHLQSLNHRGKLRITVFLLSLLSDTASQLLPKSVIIDSNAMMTSEVLIRLVLDRYRTDNSGLMLPATLCESFLSYRLYVCDSEGVIDDDFPGLDDRCTIGSMQSHHFTLRLKQKLKEKDKPRKSPSYNSNKRHSFSQSKSANNDHGGETVNGSGGNDGGGDVGLSPHISTFGIESISEGNERLMTDRPWYWFTCCLSAQSVDEVGSPEHRANRASSVGDRSSSSFSFHSFRARFAQSAGANTNATANPHIGSNVAAQSQTATNAIQR